MVHSHSIRTDSEVEFLILRKVLTVEMTTITRAHPLSPLESDPQ